MPTDRSEQTIEVAAPFDKVLATIRDVEGQVDWIPEILEAELLEVYEDDDLPATARFKASATVGTDHYTLSYEHGEETMSWTMVEGKMQTGQEGLYTLREMSGLRTNRWQTFGRLPTQNIRAIFFSRLATAFDRGEPPEITADDGLAVQAFIEAAYRSSESGQGVSPGALLQEART